MKNCYTLYCTRIFFITKSLKVSSAAPSKYIKFQINRFNGWIGVVFLCSCVLASKFIAIEFKAIPLNSWLCSKLFVWTSWVFCWILGSFCTTKLPLVRNVSLGNWLRQSGHVLILDNHSTIQALWNICLQGSLLMISFSFGTFKQIEQSSLELTSVKVISSNDSMNFRHAGVFSSTSTFLAD